MQQVSQNSYLPRRSQVRVQHALEAECTPSQKACDVENNIFYSYQALNILLDTVLVLYVV